MAAPPPVRSRTVPVAGTAPGSNTAADKQNAQGNYTFKVLRMNRPSFAVPGLPLHCSASDSASLGTDALVLPKAFGTIFLGEVRAALRQSIECCLRSPSAGAGFSRICRILQQRVARFYALRGQPLPPPHSQPSHLDAQLKAEINCGARRTQLMDNSSQPIAILPARAT